MQLIDSDWKNCAAVLNLAMARFGELVPALKLRVNQMLRQPLNKISMWIDQQTNSRNLPLCMFELMQTHRNKNFRG